MPDLIAQGREPDQRWRRRLATDVPQTIGRQAGRWSTPWDERISRQHVEVVYRDAQLLVNALPTARNPVFYRGMPATAFALQPGEYFVIGETTFTFVDQQVQVASDVPPPSGEHTFTSLELRRAPFRQADKRIDALSRLPEIIRESPTDQDLFTRLVNLLLGGIDRAQTAAVVAMSSKFKVQGSKFEPLNPTLNFEPGTLNSSDLATPNIVVLHWDRRALAAPEFRPSERLIRAAVGSGKSVAHVWSGGAAGQAASFTFSQGADWAFCTPVEGTACAGWALYVTGTFSRDFGPAGDAAADLLRDDLKFTEVIAATLSGLRESRLLAARQASLGQFFSPIVLQTIGDRDIDQALAPREADVTVLFCDLRGFSRESERSSANLFSLLERVSGALGVMTHHILEHGGVIGDFHGDAAMGFWGWPVEQRDGIERACRAALGIRRAFLGTSCTDENAAVNRGPADFRVGIGIASGRAVAGKIGTADQVKVTAFGPVVNLASRLETMTRQLGRAILVDEPTAIAIRANLPADICRVRRIAKLRPAGFAAAAEVSEILPPTSECPELSNENLTAYETALAAFTSGDWPKALAMLDAVPEADPARQFLTGYMTRHGQTPPPNWDGVVPLDSK